LINYLTQE